MNTKEKIKVMQAYLDGKTICYYYNDIEPDKVYTSNIAEGDDMEWIWDNITYYVKHTPRVIYCKETNGTLEMKAFKSEDCGNIYCEDWIKFVEEIG